VSDFDDLLRVVVRMSHQLEEIKHTATNMLREGVVEKVDGKKGYQVNFGKDEDGKPIPSAWFPHHEQGGAFKTWRPSSKGQIVYVVAPGGDQRRAFVVPRGGFSDDNPQPSDKLEENVDTFGQYRREIREKDTVDKVGKAKVSKKAEGKITAETGDQPDDGSASGGLGANVQHELNRQLQTLRADLTQARNEIAGLHEITSRFREIAQGRIPELAAIQSILDGKPDGLEKAAKMALGNLEGYMAKAFQGALGKLTNGFMSSVMGAVRGFVQGQIGGLLGQVADLASLHGISDAIADPLGAAEALVADVAAGTAHDEFGNQLGAIEAAFAGTPGEAAFALLRGQFGGALGGALDVAANLGGMLDGQQNLTKGLTRSYRLGGY
jgi:phage baseplate assembly protein gpV